MTYQNICFRSKTLDGSAPYLLNASLPDLSSALSQSTQGEGVFPLFRISYFLFGPLGALVCVVVGIVVSVLTGPTDPADIDPRFVSPAIRRFLPTKRFSASQMQLRSEYIKVNTKPTD